MIVLDASVLTNALTDDGPVGAAARAVLVTDDHWAAPGHLVVETFAAIRGRRLGGKITEVRAADAIDGLRRAVIDLVGVAPLLPRMWELRANVSGYDAAYVALAESAACALVTADVRLAGATGVRCEVRVALPGGQ